MTALPDQVNGRPASAPVPGEQAPGEPGIEEIAARLDESSAQIEVLHGEPREVVQRHIAALNDLQAGALRTIVRRLRDDPRGRELLFELVDEPIVHMALAVHGLIRATDPETRARQALDQIRPGIVAHGGDVSLVGIDEGVALVALSGACDGCSLADATVRGSVEAALAAAVPELRGVQVVSGDAAAGGAGAGGAPDEAVLAGGGQRAAGSAHMPPDLGGSGWVQTFPVARIGPGRVEAVSLVTEAGTELEAIIVGAGGRLSAFVNACPHRGMPLDGALISDLEGTLTCPWHGQTFAVADGECLSTPGSHLTPLPLRVADDHIWVRAGR